MDSIISSFPILSWMFRGCSSAKKMGRWLDPGASELGMATDGKLTSPDAYDKLQPSLLLRERRPVPCARIISPQYSTVYGGCHCGSVLVRQKGVEVLQMRLSGCLRSAEL